jgi:uncharacterized RDD family membrane protein YckC
VSVVTPENATIEYELAGIASRGGAAMIDSVILVLVVALALTLQLVLKLDIRLPGMGWAGAVLGIVAFAFFWGYFVFFETAWNGQTPGKRMLRLRAVREGGLPIDLSCAATRNLVRVIDFLPALYMVGAISVMISGRNKRLGDLAAGTIVVKERSERMDKSPSGQTSVAQQHYHEAARVKNIELVTPEEFQTIKRFVERRAELAAEVQQQLAARIARPIMRRLGIEDIPGILYANLLSEIYARCADERGLR